MDMFVIISRLISDEKLRVQMGRDNVTNVEKEYSADAKNLPPFLPDAETKILYPKKNQNAIWNHSKIFDNIKAQFINISIKTVVSP